MSTFVDKPIMEVVMRGKVLPLVLAVLGMISFSVFSSCAKKAPKKEEVKAPVQTVVPAVDPFSFEISGFRYKSYNIDDVKTELMKSENEIAEKLKEVKTFGSVQVIGHADKKGPEGPEGDKIGNLAWSQKRAESMVNYFVTKHGISRDIFTIKGMGSSQLKDASKPYDAKNRRVEIIYKK
jgi:outer membrane protein OmpA-like peptidoglycan-associated protein